MDRFRLIGALLSFAGAYGILRPEGSLTALLGGLLLDAGVAMLSRWVDACPMAFWVGFPSLSVINLAYIFALGVVSAICHFLTIVAYT